MLQPRSPFQLLLQRNPDLFRTLARRAKWGLFIGGALGVLMALLVVRNLEARCAAEAVGCELLRNKGPLMMVTVMQMAFLGAVLSTISALARMLIRTVSERDQRVLAPDGRSTPRDGAFHPSWNESRPSQSGIAPAPEPPTEPPKTEAEKHLERFRRK